MNRNRTAVLGIVIAALAWGLSARGQDPAGEAQRLYEKAQDLARDKKLDEAVEVMKQAVRLAPGKDLYLATASDLEFKAGRYADGLEHARQALRINDTVGAYYVLAAANAYGDQELDAARAYCEHVLQGGPKEFGATACDDARRVHDLVAPITCTLFWNLDPQKGRAVAGQLAIAMPKTNLPYQNVTYEISGVLAHRLVEGDVNDVLYVVPQGTQKITLTTRVSLDPTSFKKELEKAKAAARPLPAAARAYLGPCEAIDPQSPALKKVVAGLKADSGVETVRNILAWLKKNVEYKLTKPLIAELDFTSVDEIVERGHAECRGYAMLCTALCRAAGVPARPVWGLIRVAPGQDRRFGDIASHNWVEVYIAGCGWVPVDPQHPETFGFLPTTCVRMFMDAKKSKTSAELLPVINLVAMNGEKLRFEVTR